jgi:hypothetical protein
MARPPSLLRVSVLGMILACSGCASWHYRNEAKSEKPLSDGATPQQPPAPDPYDASMHGLSVNNRW